MDELPLMSARFEKARELGFDIVPYIRVYKENQNLEELINLFSVFPFLHKITNG